MSLSRIYTFKEGEGFGLMSGDRAQVQLEDEILRPTGLSNGQLAVLFVVDSQGNATVSEIAFALIMDRPAVTLNIRVLDRASAVETIRRSAGNTEAIRLTLRGRNLLRDGIELWRKAKAQRDSFQAAKSRAGNVDDGHANFDLIG